MEDIVIKKLALILSVVFIILTFIGTGYVLLNGGKVNAGYACVPMLFALISISFYRKYKWCVNDYLMGNYLGCFIAHSIILTKGEIYRYLSIQRVKEKNCRGIYLLQSKGLQQCVGKCKLYFWYGKTA